MFVIVRLFGKFGFSLGGLHISPLCGRLFGINKTICFGRKYGRS